MHIKKTTLGCLKGFSLLALTLIIFACTSEVSDEQMVQTAKQYLDQNKLRAAGLELKNALQKNTNNAEARYLLGIINIDIGDTASAEKELGRAMDAGWPEAQTYIALARSMINRKAFQKVLDTIKVTDNYSASARADLHALRALAHATLGNLEQANSALNKATEIDAKSFHVLKTTILMQLATGNIENIMDSLNQALIAYQDNQEILLLNAAIDIKNEKMAEAARTYQKIIKLEPANLVTIYGRQSRLALARLKIIDGNLELAETTIAPLFKHSTNDPETNFIGGMLAFEQGKLDLAENRLLNVLKTASDHAPTQLLFGTVNYAQQNYEQAAYYIAKYINVMPDNLAARKLLGRTYIKLGQHSDAQATLQPGLEDSANDAELLALVGLSQLQGGNISSGIEGLEKAVKAAPESSTLRSNLARAYISAGETENAIRELNAILNKDGDNRQSETLLISAHIKAKQYDQAIDIVLGMLKQTPDDPATLSLAGNVFVISNDRPEARKYFNKALQIKPDYVPATMLLAKLEEIENQPDKAEALYKKLADMNTEDIAPLMALAHLAETQNQPEKMVTWLKTANKRAPLDIKPRIILTEYYLRHKQLKEAGLLIKEAIKIAPRDKTLLVLQAKWQMSGAQYNKALSSLNELVTRAPDSFSIRTMLSETYLRLNQLPDARRQLEIVLRKQPYYLPALILMTNLELQSGKNTQALAHAEIIQKIKPDLYLGFELAGDASMMMKDYLTAKDNYRKALQSKSSAELSIKLSEASTRSGQFEAATKPLLAWLDNHPDDARVLQFLGTSHQNMKQNKKAIKIYEKVLKIQPDNIVTLNNLAWLYSLTNNPKALELAEKAQKQRPDDAGIQDTYGWILVQQGQSDKGRRILEQVMKALPDSPEVQYHYAIALLKSGEKIKAHQLLAKLLKSGKSFEGRDSAEQIMK